MVTATTSGVGAALLATKAGAPSEAQARPEADADGGSRLVDGALIAATVVAGIGAAIGVGYLMHRFPSTAAESGHAGFAALEGMGRDIARVFVPLGAGAMTAMGVGAGLSALRERL
jgi:hypothetical protein